MKTIIEATIPTTTYGNIRPTFQLESEGDESLAMGKLHELWAKYGEKPLSVSTRQIEGNKETLEERQSFTGETVMYDVANHTYFDTKGNQLLSASKYADKFSPKFDLDLMAPKTAKSWEVPEDALREVWKMNGDISTNLGNAIHLALELYHKHSIIGSSIQERKELEQNYVLPKNKYLRSIVEDFLTAYGSNAMTEVLVTDVANGMAGTIDRLQFVDDTNKTVRIGDYKTNAEMDAKKKLKYQKQLSFYAHILQNKGWTVQGLDLYHYDPSTESWSRYEMEVLPLEN